MDTNYIKKDGFSNPDTERLFESWSDARVAATVKSLKDCGACVFANFLVDSPNEYVVRLLPPRPISPAFRPSLGHLV
jgi:hypothetical protein